MTQTLTYSINDLAGYISWTYFFHAWNFPARFAAIANIHSCESCRAVWLADFPVAERTKAAEAMQLHQEALRMLAFLASKSYKVRVCFQLFECNAQNDDIIIYEPSPETAENNGAAGQMFRLSFLRQQTAPFLCLSDFIRPINPEGIRDRIGIFVAAADAAIEHSFEHEDNYRHLLCQTLADRLAEAATERAHEAIRKSYWGYAADEQLSRADLLAGRFQGIRPAVGYPCLPDQSLNFDLDRLIGFSRIGVTLTETGAMRPHACVSGLMLAHPQARYFTVGTIGDDQLADYAKRKGRTSEEIRPFLLGNLK